MHTAIGVFNSHEGATGAVTELFQSGVPRESVVFLSRSQKDARIIGRVLGGSLGSSLGFMASTLLVVPGIGDVCAFGLGATALLGLLGAAAGAAAGKSAVHNPGTPEPTPDKECSQDTAFFCDVLKQDRCLIIVRTDSPEIADAACNVLNRLGLGMGERATGAA